MYKSINTHTVDTWMTDRQIGYIEWIYLKEFRLKHYMMKTLRVILVYEARRGEGRGEDCDLLCKCWRFSWMQHLCLESHHVLPL